MNMTNVDESVPAICFDDLPNGVIVIGDGGVMLGVNTAMLAMLGSERDAVVGQPLNSVLTRPAAVLYQAVLAPQLRGQGVVGETYLEFKGRSSAGVPALCTARLHEKGLQTVIVLSAMPMQDRLRLEEKLLKTKQVADQMPGVVYQYLVGADGSHSIPYTSDALHSMFGIGPTEPQQSADALLRSVHPDDIEHVAASIAESAETLQPWRTQFRLRLLDGSYRWMEGHSTPERLEDGSTLWHGFMQDVTDRRVIEDALRDKQIADRASKAKSEFLARVSHEFRTPLNAILGFAQVLTQGGAEPLKPLQRARIHHIERAGRDLLNLIDEVLDVTSIESGGVNLEPSWLNVKSLVSRVAKLVEVPVRDRDITLELVAHSTISLYADPARLGQIVTNLLSNAVNYVQTGGTVTVTCALENRQIVISVHDTGPGMTDTQVAHLFEPFNRLGAERTSIHGTGLGLVIVKRLVEAMEGSVSASSSRDGGSTFRVTLPQRPRGMASNDDAGASSMAGFLTSTITAVVPTTVSAALAPTEAAPIEPRSASVLYVEDNPVNAMIMQAICEYQPGLTLHVETTGAAAVEWARSHRVDLLLLDMTLPDGNGVDLIKRLKDACGNPDIEAIAVSAEAMPDYIERARAAGFGQYWTKPLDVRSTLDRLAVLLGLERTSKFGREPLAA